MDFVYEQLMDYEDGQAKLYEWIELLDSGSQWIHELISNICAIQFAAHLTSRPPLQLSSVKVGLTLQGLSHQSSGHTAASSLDEANLRRELILLGDHD
jgi:hypothetical protein